MNKILIATDLSAASRNASVYGMQLAKSIKADVILFSAYEAGHPFADLNVQVSRLAVMEETTKLLSDEAETLRKEYNAQFEIVCEEGAPSEAIFAIAKEKKVDLIIVGMNGRGKSLKKLFGSTATSLVKSLTIPVIVVPEDSKFTAPKNILYASDVFLDTRVTAIDQVKWLTGFFASKLFVVRVVKDGYEEVRENVNIPSTLRKELKILNASFSFPINKNIADGLNEFLSEQKVDLMVMLPHKHEWMDSLFVKNETKNMVLHSSIPVLMLPDTAGDVAKCNMQDAIGNYINDKH